MGKLMGIDFGDVRTGVATSDPTGLIASGAGCIQSTNLRRTAEIAAEMAKEKGVTAIVVGHPINMNGTAGPRSELCHQVADELREKSGLPVEMWDERSTTVTAIGYLNETNTRGKKRKAVVDRVAATIILESYLMYRKNHPE